MLALIGSRWLTVTGADGQRRRDDPDDYVAMELRLALESGLPVIPVLVHGARMPPADQLPEAIRALALQSVAGAPGAAGVREWPIMSR